MSSIEQVFSAISSGIAADQSIIQKINAIYKFEIDGASWFVDLKNGNGGVSQNGTQADVTLTLSTDNFLALMSGQLNGQQAFMQGKLKLKGNMALAMKLSQLVSVMNAAPAPTGNTTNSGEVTPEFIFGEIRNNVENDPSILKKVGAVYKFIVDGDSWIVDLKNGSGNVGRGDGDADTTITIAAADFVDLMTGKLNGQQAFMQGKLKIKGNMANAMKLSQLTTSKAKL